MDLRCLVYVTCVVITFGDYVASSSTFQDCLRKDSITCLQMQLFRAARGLVDNSSIEVFGGIELIKIGTKQGKSLELKQTEESIENALDVETRQKALETYLIAAGERLWKERTVTWNPAQTAKTLVNAVPETVTSQLTSFVSEARGKKKHHPLKDIIKEIIKEREETTEKEEAKDKKEKKAQMLMPLLIALKLKFTTIAAIAGMIIAVIAKKALIAGVLSLVLSGITALADLKGLTGSKQQPQGAEVIAYQYPGGWEPYSYSGGKTFKLWSQGVTK